MGFDAFLDLLREELDLEPAGLGPEAELEAVPGWDSVLLLQLVVVLERRQSPPKRNLPIRDLIEARTLGRLHELATEVR
ncbi:phosphopantetheine-binding protein [Streptomyces sp. SP17BM10]|uniref:phosphopantetheine-binding protein n=1 Tax=Streptomyces sp. SP17BM10 TaxID=3002530 RepID=UPI002E775674|nr:phosphopantetheine-binding protein [Streptomyces sp. SP17BM10]MEE1781616.1 phosphopantetheine-binding protein [Streptomyces sp. SP17BM10]